MARKTPSTGFYTKRGIAVVKVGTAADEHRVHKALLVQHSDYFSKALTGPWTEAETQSIDLDDVDTTTFCIFVHWLYTQKIPMSPSDWREASLVDESEEAEKSNEEFLLIWLKAYAFADGILANGFRRATNEAAVITTLKCKTFDTAGREAITFAFAGAIPPDRAILQCLVVRFCANWYSDDYERYGPQVTDEMPAAFLSRVARRYQYLFELYEKTGATLPKIKRCFLEHQSEEAKEKCGKLHMRWDQDKQLGFFQ